jgi:hypothetical protein
VGLGVGDGRGVFVGVSVIVEVGSGVSVDAGVDVGCAVKELHANETKMRTNNQEIRGIVF